MSLYEQIRQLLRSSSSVTSLLGAGTLGILPCANGSILLEPGESSPTPFIVVSRPQELPLGIGNRLTLWEINIYYDYGSEIDDLIAAIEAILAVSEGKLLQPDRRRAYRQINPASYVGPLPDDGWHKLLITLNYNAQGVS